MFVPPLALEVLPRLPILSDDPSVIGVADGVRVCILIAGLALSSLAVHHAVVVDRTSAPPRELLRGFRWRSTALVIATLYVCLSTFDRIGQPVNGQFILAVVFLVVVARCVHIVADLPRPPLPSEDHLQDHFTAGSPPARPRA